MVPAHAYSKVFCNPKIIYTHKQTTNTTSSIANANKNYFVDDECVFGTRLTDTHRLNRTCTSSYTLTDFYRDRYGVGISSSKLQNRNLCSICVYRAYIVCTLGAEAFFFIHEKIILKQIQAIETIGKPVCLN